MLDVAVFWAEKFRLRDAVTLLVPEVYNLTSGLVFCIIYTFY
jgi:hypothetical protein